MASKLLTALLGLDAETVEAQAAAKATKDLSEVKVLKERQEVQGERIERIIRFAQSLGIEIYKVDPKTQTKTFDKDAWRNAVEMYNLAAGKVD